MYADVDLTLPDQIDETKAAKANDKIEGRTDKVKGLVLKTEFLKKA